MCICICVYMYMCIYVYMYVCLSGPSSPSNDFVVKSWIVRRLSFAHACFSDASRQRVRLHVHLERSRFMGTTVQLRVLSQCMSMLQMWMEH